MIDIVQVNGKKDLTKFIDYPHDLYKNDPNYVPMLYMEQEALLNAKKSPFFKHSTADYFLAHKDGKILGRITAILNRNPCVNLRGEAGKDFLRLRLDGH